MADFANLALSRSSACWSITVDATVNCCRNTYEITIAGIEKLSEMLHTDELSYESCCWFLPSRSRPSGNLQSGYQPTEVNEIETQSAGFQHQSETSAAVQSDTQIDGFYDQPDPIVKSNGKSSVRAPARDSSITSYDERTKLKKMNQNQGNENIRLAL